MKKIAVITSGLLPMPAVKDGAIEMLLQFIIDYNEVNRNCDFTIYSIYDDEAKQKALRYKNTIFRYVKVNKLMNFIYYNFCRIMRKLGIKDPNFQYFFITKVIKLLKKEKYDYILVESENHFAYHILKKLNIPVILYLHNDKLNKGIKHADYIVKNVYKIFTVSNYLKRQVLTLGEVYSNKVSVVLNGIDFNEFDTSMYSNWNIQYRKEKNIKEQDFVFLFVGRLEPNKGVLELIKAFNKLSQKAKLIIVGGSFHSSNKKSKYCNLLYREAAKNQLNDIEFVGYVKHSNLKYYYAMANVVVVPSMWEEPAGLVNIEALYSGCGLIANNVGGIGEYVDNSAFLVEKNENIIDNLYNALDKSFKCKNSNSKNSSNINYFSKEEYCERFFSQLNIVMKNKVAIITSGLLPVPAVRGGAIETLIDSFVKENERFQKILIDVYSIGDKSLKKTNNTLQYTRYRYIGSFGNFLIRIINKALKTKFPINKFYQAHVIRLIKKEKYDYVIIENYPNLVLKLLDFNVIPYIHSDVLNVDTINGKDILKNSYKILTVSNFIKSQVCKIDKSFYRKVVTIYNSVDFHTVDLQKKDEYSNFYRKKYAIDKNDIVFAYLGRVSEEKGVYELAKSFDNANIENAKLLIIGGVWYGTNKTNKYVDKIKALNNKNIIFTGYINHSEIDSLLCACNVGVVPSICNEAAGLSIVEFMNLGLKVIATDNGGIKEYLNVKDNELIMYKTKEELIIKLENALKKCAENSQCLSSIASQNIKFSKFFSIENNYNSIIKELNRR